MDFKKYNSINNSFNIKTLEDLRTRNISFFLKDVEFEITEKIDGANFSILIENGETVLAKRTSILKETEKFYDFQNTFSQDLYIPIFECLNKLSKEFGKVQLYGEYFGGKINKRVFYGEGKRFLWFTLKINDEMVETKRANELLKDIMSFKVPVIGTEVLKTSETIEDFLSRIDIDFRSKVTPALYKEDNLCEGVVIVPTDFVPMFGDNFFAIKKKNAKFIDREQKKRIKTEIVLPDEVQDALDVICSFVNENRTNDLMSKMGDLESTNDLPKYAKAYMADVKNDFELSNNELMLNFEKKWVTFVYKSCNSYIFKELVRYLQEE